MSDNNISSIKVNGFQVIAFKDDNFSGEQLTLGSDDNSLADNGWNDQISSIKVLEQQTPNQPPVVNITTPDNGANFIAPATFTLTVNASDTDGNINKVEFYDGSKKIGESTVSPYIFNWNNVPFGNISNNRCCLR